jgi:hypothetical protein
LSGSGKSSLLRSIIAEQSTTHDKIILISPTIEKILPIKNLVNKQVKTGDEVDLFVNKIILFQESKKERGEDLLSILICFDDFASLYIKKQAENSVCLRILSTRGRHLNLSYIVSSQLYKSVPPCIRKNSEFLIFAKNIVVESKDIAEDKFKIPATTLRAINTIMFRNGIGIYCIIHPDYIQDDFCKLYSMNDRRYIS